MKLNRTIAAAVAVPLLGLSLAACGNWKVSLPGNEGTATCSVNAHGGKCSMNGRTVGVSPAGSDHATASPVTRRTPVPTDGSPVVPGATAPQPDPTQAVATCLGNTPSTDTLLSLTQGQGQNSLSGCLALTPAETSQLFSILVHEILDAYGHHQFDTQQQRTTFTQTTVVSDVSQCEQSS